MKQTNKTVTQLIAALIIVFISLTPGLSAEIDDSTVFIEAFNAYQQKDYLLSIEKSDQLNQVFPDSPLRDVALLLTARACLKSGNNERAAKAVTLFTADFPESSLKTSVEDELRELASRLQKGEVLTANKSLQTAANKVRSDRLERERTAELKIQIERAAKEKAEQERLARIRMEVERIEKERLLAEKLAKESIKASITLHQGTEVFPVGGGWRLPVEISNTGGSREEFSLTATAAKGYNPYLVSVSKPEAQVNSIWLAPGETFIGAVAFTMPAEMVDGHRSALLVKAVSAKYSDIGFHKEVLVISSAPLVRAVAKLAESKVFPGEKLLYRLTVLNAGSLPAIDLTVRLRLPPQIDFQGATNVPFKQEPDGTLVFNVSRIETGQLADINLNVMIRGDSAVGQELRGQVEIIDGSLKRKETFTVCVSVIK